MRVLVIDVGGTNVKVLATGQRQPRRIPSGPTMTAEDMVAGVKPVAADWKYDVVSIGYPGAVIGGRPLHEPKNLGGGWVGFDFGKAFGCPVKMVNDAAMQALGSYEGGRMLFLGLGTGLGSAMIVDGILEPMELAHLPYKKGRTYEEYLGRQALKSLGKKRWRRHVADVVERFKSTLEADYIVLGGATPRKSGNYHRAPVSALTPMPSSAGFGSGRRPSPSRGPLGGGSTMPRTIVLYAALALATFALMLGGHSAGSAGAGTATPNVAGKWEGTWTHRAGSGQITLQLAQEGTKVTGKQSLPSVMPVFGTEGQQQIRLGTEVREGHLEDSTLIFHVEAPDTPGGRVNFTLTVSGESMTGTACGYTCATLKLKKVPF